MLQHSGPASVQHLGRTAAKPKIAISEIPLQLPPNPEAPTAPCKGFPRMLSITLILSKPGNTEPRLPPKPVGIWRQEPAPKVQGAADTFETLTR